MQDTWKLGGHEFTSRFILGSGKYDLNLIKAAVEDAGAQIITLALRRANTGDTENILDYILKGVTLLPNTSGVRTADEAVLAAQMSREIFRTPFIKLEIHPDPKYLMPDPIETLAATERLARDGGEEGKKKIQSITRYATVAIAIIQGVGYFFLMKNYGILTSTSVWAALVIIVSFIAGSSFVMWMGEQITEFGIGNGISIILFAGILSRVPTMVSQMVGGMRAGSLKWWMVLLVIVGILLLIVLITWVNGAERRIPVQYAKRQVGRKMYGGQSSTLPMKVNMSGVLPIIFAQSIAMIPSTIAAFCKQPKEGTFWYGFLNAIDTKSVLYMIFYFLMIIAFSYFYATIQFNPVEISNNLKKNGGFIPGFRPGNPTAAFIQKVLNKVTLFGAVYLGIVAILPLIIGKIVNVAALSIGGTSVIIVVGVALETVQALESQMLMRQYKGFLE